MKNRTTIHRIVLSCIIQTGVLMPLLAANSTMSNQVESAQQQVQQKQISGTVKDESGEKLQGVTVTVKGTSTGTITDAYGHYTLKVAEQSNILVFSFIGMKKQEVDINGKSIVNVTMEGNSVVLQEVVSVGYGTIRKSDLTGSVSKVTILDTDEKPTTTIDQLLQGRTSGVQITQSSGAPGAGLSFLIRGAGSTSNNQPLIVIDGYPIDMSPTDMNQGLAGGTQPPTNPLANLNPNDIESVEILKDASSIAIYGSRGANGVVLITTKTGKKGKDRIEFNFRNDFSQVRNKIKVLNSKDFITFTNECYINDGIATRLDTALAATNHDWFDEISRASNVKDYQLSISGGEGKTTYSIIGNYLDNQGIIKNSSFQRAGVRMNYNREFSSRINFRSNFNASRTNYAMSTGGGRQGLPSESVILGALYFKPFANAYDADGDIDQSTANNPLTVVNLVKDDQVNNLILGNLKLDINLIKDLVFKVNLGANYSNNIRRFYWPRGTWQGDLNKGYGYQNSVNRFDYLSEFTLNLIKSIGKNRINAVVGYTYQNWLVDGLAASASQFPNDNLTYYRLQLGNTQGIPTTTYQNWSLVSFLGRANYSMNNKYLVTLTARYDGASRLAIGHKWDFFPSFALGWNVHNEKFMKSVDFIKSLKLRGSIGLSGSQSVAIGQNLPLLTTDRVAVNQTIQNGYSMANIANPNLGWEHSRQINAGFDLGVFNNRVLLEFNIYQKNTTDLLINLPIPSSNGFGIFTTNAGEIENKGMELDLTVRAIDKKLKWNINGNISFNRNKMINLGPLGDLGSIYGQTYGGPEQPIHVSRVGLPVGSYFGYKIDGIYQNTTEVAEGPESSTARPGDFKFVDISGPNGVPDGIITADDRTIIGNPYPDYTFGLTNDLLWKGFSLSVFFQGTIGNDVINLTRYKLDGLTSVTFNVSQAAFDGRWQGEGTSNKYPAPRSLGNPFSNRFSDFVVEDGSFIRLKNVTLGYEIPVNKLGLSNLINGLKVFVTGTNLLTITKYTGYDPEVNVNYNSPLTPGVDNGTYPSVRTFSFGINLKL